MASNLPEERKILNYAQNKHFLFSMPCTYERKVVRVSIRVFEEKKVKKSQETKSEMQE